MSPEARAKVAAAQKLRWEKFHAEQAKVSKPVTTKTTKKTVSDSEQQQERRCRAGYLGGSGSTLIACAKHGREARLLEIDPKYCDVIIRRWQEWSGEEAHNEEGRSFEDVSNDRLTADDPAAKMTAERG